MILNNGGITAQASGDMVIENCMVTLYGLNAGRFGLRANHASAAIRTYFCTLIVVEPDGFGGRVILHTSGLTSCANCIAYSTNSDWAAGAVTADYNVVHSASPSQINGWVEKVYDMGFACNVDSYGNKDDFRVIASSEKQGTTSFNGDDLTVYDKDIDGRTRTTWAVGCSEGFDLIQNADFPAETDVRATIDYDDGSLTGNATFPVEANVREDIEYGANGTEYTGTLAVGVEANAPTLDSVTPGANSMTLYITAATETDVIYGRYRRNSPAYSWAEKSESFKVTGSGSVTITGLIDGIEYEFAAQNMVGGIAGTGSDFAGSRFAMPDSDAFAVSRYNEKLNERNGTARVNWEVARRRGVKVTFKNGPDADAVVYAKVAQPSTVTIGVRTGQIDRSDIVISVPRQTNFPPSRFYPNATFTLNTKSYQIDNVDFDNEDINMTAVFILTASVLGIEDGY
ncbi:MAG: hypothetical protein JRE23_18250 [Deltaproteobacteria bacterium]|nr:hypothetical protein [Deltaproteobacteria bacterium]